MMSPMSSVGSPTAVRTMSIVTRPASGTPAAPIAAAVAVTLQQETNECVTVCVVALRMRGVV